MNRWLRRLRCWHPIWTEGGLTNFMTGAHEYRCNLCGKRIERRSPPLNYVGDAPRAKTSPAESDNA